MNIIHIVNDITLARHVEPLLSMSLDAMPAVVVTGARQTGKSTLVAQRTPGPRRFFSLDDFDVLDLARRDPGSLVENPEPITLDEVQREPDLLLAVKRSIDRSRRTGQFLLTGSANLLLMRTVSESLAGRASFLTLWPMTRREQRGFGRCGLWQELIQSDPLDWVERIRADEAGEEDWRKLALRGGFPTPAVHMNTPADRAIWFDGYTRSYLDRDLRSE